MVKIHDIRYRTPRTNGTRNLSQVKNIARHHSATATGNFDSFWSFWHNTRGWGTGGYHEIILRDGSVELCYGPEEITNGVANTNAVVYNICLVGNGTFTEEQERAFDIRAKVAMKLFNLPVSAVRGHGEFPGSFTTCPGIDMNAVRKRLSNEVEQVSNPKPTIEPTVKPTVKPAVQSKPSTESIVDWMNKNKMDSSFANRAKLAKHHGFRDYRGTADQNIALLSMLQNSKPVSKPSTVDVKTNSVVDWLNANKMDSSFSNRAKLAREIGIKNYRGTAAQNIALLSKLRK